MTGAEAAVLAAYVLANLLSFAAYGWDKRKARRNEWRTPEKRLLALGLLGPWGAVLGMRVFHHKTRKTRFKANYVFLTLHIAIICLIVSGQLRLDSDLLAGPLR